MGLAAALQEERCFTETKELFPGKEKLSPEDCLHCDKSHRRVECDEMVEREVQLPPNVLNLH